MYSPHNTKHVRSILRSFDIPNSCTWTNKYPKQTTVKCYVGNNLRKLSLVNNELVKHGYDTTITMVRPNDTRMSAKPYLMGIITRIDPMRIVK